MTNSEHELEFTFAKNGSFFYLDYNTMSVRGFSKSQQTDQVLATTALKATEFPHDVVTPAPVQIFHPR